MPGSPLAGVPLRYKSLGAGDRSFLTFPRPHPSACTSKCLPKFLIDDLFYEVRQIDIKLFRGKQLHEISQGKK